MSDNELDNLFKEAADGFKVPMDSSAWKDMSKKLDQAGVGTSVLWNWKTISGITAISVLSGALIWYASQRDVDQSIANKNSIDTEIKGEALKSDQTETEILITDQPKTSDLSLDTSKNQNAASSGNTNPDASNSSTKSSSRNASEVGEEKVAVIENSSKKGKSNASKASNASPSTVSEGDSKKSTNEKSSAEGEIIPAGIIVANELNTAKAETQNKSVNENQVSSTVLNRDVNETQVVTDSVIKPVEESLVAAERTNSASKKDEPREEKVKAASAISFKVAVAPDFSSINYFTPDGSGFNFGALVGYSFNNRWSVYTGAILSRKIYSSTEIDEEYTTSSGYPYDIEELTGDCRVLDIPINVYYSFFPEKSFSIKAGLGFTSYLMLSEEYTYYIDNPYGSDVYHQKIEHENNEWFKMMNISMIVQKRLSNQFSFELEPFLKAPLAGVGEGEVSLVSIGAFLNLRFDIPINKSK